VDGYRDHLAVKHVNPQEFPVSGTPDHQPADRSSGPGADVLRRPGRRTAMIAVAVLVLGTAAWAITVNGGSGDPAIATGSPALVKPGDLMAFGVLVGHPVFWAGARDGARLEFRGDRTGNVHLRYLTGKAEPGTTDERFLNISTYPSAGAFEATRALSRTEGFRQVKVGGGVGFLDPERPYSVVLAWPSYPNIQVDVFDPVRYRALKVVRSGDIVPVSIP